MDQGRVFSERLVDGEYCGNGFVIALDKVDRLVGGLLIDGGDRGDDVADITRFIARKKFFILNAEAESLRRRAAGDENRRDASQRARPPHIETENLCVWKGTAKQPGVEQARQGDIDGVDRAAGDAVNAIQSRQRLADNSKWFHEADGVFGGA